MPERAYACTTPILPEPSVYYVSAPTTARKAASKARMQCLRNAWDAGYEITFSDVKVRSLGMRETPREVEERKCAIFNLTHRAGEPVMCWPFIPPDPRDIEHAKVRELLSPGAYVAAAGYAVVPVRGGVYAIEAVTGVVRGCVLIEVQDVTPPPPPKQTDYIFEETSAHGELRRNGAMLMKFATYNNFYGQGTCVSNAIKEMQTYAADNDINEMSEVELVVVKTTSLRRMRPQSDTNYYAPDFALFATLSSGWDRDLPEDTEIDVWSSRTPGEAKTEDSNG